MWPWRSRVRIPSATPYFQCLADTGSVRVSPWAPDGFRREGCWTGSKRGDDARRRTSPGVVRPLSHFRTRRPGELAQHLDRRQSMWPAEGDMGHPSVEDRAASRYKTLKRRWERRAGRLAQPRIKIVGRARLVSANDRLPRSDEIAAQQRGRCISRGNAARSASLPSHFLGGGRGGEGLTAANPGGSLAV